MSGRQLYMGSSQLVASQTMGLSPRKLWGGGGLEAVESMTGANGYTLSQRRVKKSQRKRHTAYCGLFVFLEVIVDEAKD